MHEMVVRVSTNPQVPNKIVFASINQQWSNTDNRALTRKKANKVKKRKGHNREHSSALFAVRRQEYAITIKGKHAMSTAQTELKCHGANEPEQQTP